jgi:hypothetical protein
MLRLVLVQEADALLRMRDRSTEIMSGILRELDLEETRLET